jgi:hypothetical protein
MEMSFRFVPLPCLVVGVIPPNRCLDECPVHPAMSQAVVVVVTPPLGRVMEAVTPPLYPFPCCQKLRKNETGSNSTDTTPFGKSQNQTKFMQRSPLDPY